MALPAALADLWPGCGGAACRAARKVQVCYEGNGGTSRGGQTYRVRCEVYAKLLALVVRHWLLLLGGGGFSERSQRKAARQVRRLAMCVAAVWDCRRELRRLLRLLAGVPRRCGRVNRRRGRPSTYQTLVNPAHDGLT